MAKVVVIGAGAMGLAAAYHALKAGHDVDVVEASNIPGGMAAILISAVFRWNGIITLFARRTIRSLSSWRIIRIGRSRRSVMQESLGYIDGGSMALIDSLVKAIEWQGGRIHVTLRSAK
jgi:phytoene dehydrogenase-like protein